MMKSDAGLKQTLKSKSTLARDILALFLLAISVTPSAETVTPAFHAFIERETNAWGVNAALVKAVIMVESGFYSDARSSKGAMGLMQLMPDTARRFGVENPMDPLQNITGGVRYLRFLLDSFAGDLSLALAGYNAGENSVIRYGGLPPYPETKEYVERVLDILHDYESIPPKGIEGNAHRKNWRILGVPSKTRSASSLIQKFNQYSSLMRSDAVFPKFDSCRIGRVCKFSENDKQQLITRRLRWQSEARLKRITLRDEQSRIP
ncbi:soluble lytic murein transglycosylase [Gammaproteobacteria bacterium]